MGKYSRELIDQQVQKYEQEQKEKTEDSFEERLYFVCFCIALLVGIASIFFTKKSDSIFVNIFGGLAQIIGVTIGIYMLLALSILILSVFYMVISVNLKKIKLITKAPKENYHIFGYITFLYLMFVVMLSWYYGGIEYGYYEILRWLVTAFAAWTFVRIYSRNLKSRWLLIFAAIAVLFNPVIKISLDKDVWQIIDVVTLVVFAIYALPAFKELKQD